MTKPSASLVFAFVFSAAGLASTLAATLADDAPNKINYKDDVAPLFQARCNSCHNQDKKKGGLVLDNYTQLMQGGASGTVVEPGDAGNSRLYLLVAHDEEPKMPPNVDRIPDTELDLLKKWIEAGAPETSGSVVVVKEKPKIDFKLDPASIGQPAGAPAMPEGISTEPLIVSAKPNAITALAHSPWAPLAAVAGHKQVLLYDTQTFNLIGVLPFPEGIIESLRFTRDGALLLAGGGRGGQLGKVIVWDVKTGERVIEVGQEYDTVLAADISPDRSLIALGGPSKVLRVYDTATNELVYECKKHTEWVTAVAFSPDGVLLASGDRNGGLLVWEAANGREFYDLRNHSAMITALDWRLDSNLLASSSEDGTIRLWEMQNGGNVKGWGAHGGGTLAVRFAKDGRLASAGRDRLAKIWNQEGNMERQFEPFVDIALQVAFNHETNSLLSGDFAGSLRIFELAEGKPIATLSANPPAVATRLAAALEQLSAAEQVAATLKAELEATESDYNGKAQAAEAARHAHAGATEATNAAASTLASAEEEHAAHSKIESDVAIALDAARSAAQLARQRRDAALADLHAKAEAVATARQTADLDRASREQAIAERAEAALLAATEDIKSNLPRWADTIDAASALEAARNRAIAQLLVAETRLPVLKLAHARASEGATQTAAALAAAEQTRADAETRLVQKRQELDQAAARVAALRVQAEALKAEQARLAATRDAAAHASAR